MKSRIAPIAVVLLALLSPQHMFAACPNVSGANWLGGSCWYIYDLTDSANGCLTTSQSGATLSCYSMAGLNYDYVSPGGEAWTTYEFTVSGSGSSTWSLFHRVDFTDPNDSIWNFAHITVTVKRSGSTIYSNQFFNHNGTQGDLSCAQPTVTTFSAQNGDVINITIGTQALYSGTQIRISHPYLTRSC